MKPWSTACACLGLLLASTAAVALPPGPTSWAEPDLMSVAPEAAEGRGALAFEHLTPAEQQLLRRYAQRWASLPPQRRAALGHLAAATARSVGARRASLAGRYAGRAPSLAAVLPPLAYFATRRAGALARTLGVPWAGRARAPARLAAVWPATRPSASIGCTAPAHPAAPAGPAATPRRRGMSRRLLPFADG